MQFAKMSVYYLLHVVCFIMVVNCLLKAFIIYLAIVAALLLNVIVTIVCLILLCMVFHRVCFVCGPTVCLDVPSGYLFCVVVSGKLRVLKCLFLVCVLLVSGLLYFCSFHFFCELYSVCFLAGL